MRFKRKFTCLALTLALVATCASPMVVNADTAWTAPTTPLVATSNIVKVGAHAAATSAVHYLGGNLITERASDYSAITGASDAAAQFEAAKARTELGVYGTAINDSPDPYLWNYLYNKGVSAGSISGTLVSNEVYLANVSSPFSADTTIVSEFGTSATLYFRPQVLFGTGGTGYDELIANLPENLDASMEDYDPVQVAYNITDFYSQIDAMYSLSDGIIASGKAGRYDTATENTNTIAQKYEAYAKGLQLYVLSEIAKGTVSKKTVAIIDPTGVDDNADGVIDKYVCYNSSTSSGTAASCRGAEYCENTTNNIIDTLSLSKADDGKYYATPAQVASSDAIITMVQAQITTTEAAMKQKLVDAGISETDIPPIYATDPAGIFSIRANSVENIFGFPVVQGFLYPEIVNPVYASMYLYQNFWHVSGSADLISLANANFAGASLAEGITAEGTGYSEAAIESKISQGLKYYLRNQSKFEGTKLQPTDRLNLTGQLTSVNTGTISAISNKAYTGQAITPAVTVTVDGVTLEKDIDYSVAYTNNTVTGKATIKVTGIGQYTGSKSTNFYIVPKKASISKTSCPKSETLIVTATKDIQASGYQFQIATNSKMTNNVRTGTTTTNTTVSKTFTKLVKGTAYYVRARSFKVIDGKKYYGAWSDIKVIPKKGTIYKVYSPKSAALTVTVKKDTIASGYQIKIATNSKMTNNIRVATLTKNSSVTKTFTKLKRGTTYYAKTRSYKLINGKYYYGAWSVIKSAKTK